MASAQRSRKLCNYGGNCKKEDCIFTHPDKESVPDSKDRNNGDKKDFRRPIKSSTVGQSGAWGCANDCTHFDGRVNSCRYGVDCVKLHELKGRRKMCFAYCLHQKCDKTSHPGFDHPKELSLSFGDKTCLALLEQQAILKAKFGDKAGDSDGSD